MFNEYQRKKCHIIINWSRRKPNFDPSYIMKLSRQEYPFTHKQNNAIDTIIRKWRIDTSELIGCSDCNYSGTVYACEDIYIDCPTCNMRPWI